MHVIEQLDTICEEIWGPVPGYEDCALISNMGRVRSIDHYVTFPVVDFVNSKGTRVHHDEYQMLIRGKLRTPSYDEDGYLDIHFQSNDGRNWYERVHRVVALGFIPNPENKPFIDHINGIRDDNRATNLRWVTAAENTQSSIDRLGNWKSESNSGNRVYCIDCDKWFDSQKAAGLCAGGPDDGGSSFLQRLNRGSPYKGHVFIREQDISKYSDLQRFCKNALHNYKGPNSGNR